MLKILIPAFAGAIVYFLVGWLVFEGLLGNFMNANTTQIVGFKKTDAEASMLLIFVSCAAYALLLALFFGQWAKVETLQDAFIISATIGMLVATMTNTYWYATSHFFNGFVPILADIAAAGFTVGIMGVAVSWAGRYF